MRCEIRIQQCRLLLGELRHIGTVFVFYRINQEIQYSGNEGYHNEMFKTNIGKRMIALDQSGRMQKFRDYFSFTYGAPSSSQ